MSISIQQLTDALQKVECIHKVKLENVHQFVKSNESHTLDVFTKLAEKASIDEKFLSIDKAFPSLLNEANYLLEVSLLLS